MGIQWTFDSSVQDRLSSGKSETWVVLAGENIGYAENGSFEVERITAVINHYVEINRHIVLVTRHWRECNEEFRDPLRKRESERQLDCVFISRQRNDDIELLRLAFFLKCNWISKDTFASKLLSAGSALSDDIRRWLLEHQRRKAIKFRIG